MIKHLRLHLRLVAPRMAKRITFLLMAQCALCAEESTSLEAAPINIPATELWDGNDGPWSSFFIQVGTPAQDLRLLPSNSSNAVWPVLPQGCTTGDPDDCSDLRGTLFLPNASSTWNNIGLYDLFLPEEWPLGYSGNSNFGYDNLTLGWPGGGLPTLSRQVIEGFATKDFYIGSFGLNPHAVNISTLDNPQPSLLGALNNVTFPFGPDTSRDLIVPIQSITSDAASRLLLSTIIYAYIDSLVPHIWLPLEVCQAFEQAFGLTYNETAELYFVNDTLHDKLVSQNPNVTFKLGPASAGGSTVDIVMQYGSFDLTAEYPIVNNATRYFSLKQAQNDRQYTLGRAFLQDAYVIADYDRSNFSVSQAVFPHGSNAQRIVAIHRPGDVVPSTHHQALSTNDTVGLAVAAVVSSSIIIAAIIRYVVRKRVEEHASKMPSTAEPETGDGELRNIQQSHYLEMPVTDPKELTAVEARRPELPSHPPFPVFEIPEPTPELEDTPVAHAK